VTQQTIMFQLTHSRGEMSNSSARIFMHGVEYSLALLDLADDRRAAFSILVVGNQILPADYSRGIGHVLATICARRISGSDVTICVPSEWGCRGFISFGVRLQAGSGGAMNVAGVCSLGTRAAGRQRRQALPAACGSAGTALRDTAAGVVMAI
jgi:hypothetical protein